MKKSIRAIALYTLSAGASAVLPVLILPIIANDLGPVFFGYLSTARSAMPLVGFFVGSFLGFGLSRVFYEAETHEYYARVNGANLSTLLLGVFWTIVGLLIVPFFNIPGLSTDLMVFLVVFGAVGFVWRQNYHRMIVMIPRPGIAAGSELFFNLMIFGALLLLRSAGGNWVEMVASQTVIFVLTAGVSAFLVFSLLGKRGATGFDFDWSRQNFRRSFPFIIVGMVTPLLLTIDKFIIASVLGAEAMGVYAATSLYLSGMFLLSGVFSKVYVPAVYETLSKFHETSDFKYLKLARDRFRLVMLGLCPLVAVLAIVCTAHAYLALDERYRLAAEITWLVVIAGASSFVQIALIPFFDSFRRGSAMSVLSFAGVAFSAVGLWVGASLAGLWGAAAGLAFGQILYVVLSLVSFARLLPVSSE